MAYGAHICALAAREKEFGAGLFPAEKLELGNVYEARLALDLFALARKLVERHAVDLLGGKHGGGLVLVSEKLCHLPQEGVPVEGLRHGKLFYHFSVGVLRVGLLAELELALVNLV